MLIEKLTPSGLPLNEVHGSSLTPVPPPLPAKHSQKHRSRRVNRHTSNAPPVPPRPALPQSFPGSASAPPSSWLVPTSRGCDTLDSDSDFEDSAVVHKIRHTVRAGSEPAAIARGLVAQDRERTGGRSRPMLPKKPHTVLSKGLSPAVRSSKKMVTLRRSRSVEFLEDAGYLTIPDRRDSISSQESAVYSLPFQHLERWRRAVGLRDSSALTGSLPCLDLDDTFGYICPNQFRSIVSRVRGESIKLGSDTSKKVMKRMDSVVRSHRSQAASNLRSRADYLSLVGEDSEFSWLRKYRSHKQGQSSTQHYKTPPVVQAKPKRSQQQYENQGPPHAQPQPQAAVGSSVRKPLPASVELPFDDPLYGGGRRPLVPPPPYHKPSPEHKHFIYQKSRKTSTSPSPSPSTSPLSRLRREGRNMSEPLLSIPLRVDREGRPPVPPRPQKPRMLQQHKSLHQTLSAEDSKTAPPTRGCSRTTPKGDTKAEDSKSVVSWNVWHDEYAGS